MLGLFPEITFEAQSAMALEFLSGEKGISGKDNYPYNLEKDKINIIPLIRAVANDVQRKEPLHKIAEKFHCTVINFTLEAVKKAHRKTGLNKVVLSGGVMQNKVLLEGISKVLTKNNFTVFVPSVLPLTMVRYLSVRWWLEISFSSRKEQSDNDSRLDNCDYLDSTQALESK